MLAPPSTRCAAFGAGGRALPAWPRVSVTVTIQASAVPASAPAPRPRRLAGGLDGLLTDGAPPMQPAPAFAAARAFAAGSGFLPGQMIDRTI